MKENNSREYNPTRRVAMKGVEMATMRSMGETRDTSNRGK